MIKKKLSNAEKGEVTVARILQAAAQMVAKYGSKGLSLHEIAAAAGVSKTGLLHHFNTKEQLLAAILDWRDEIDQFPLVLGGNVGRAGFEYFIQSVSGWKDRPENIGLFTVLLIENLAEGPFHERMIERAQRVNEGIANAVREGQRRGEFRDDFDANLLAGEWIAFVNGLETYWLLDPTIDPVAIARNWVNRLYGQILTETAGQGSCSNATSDREKG